MDYSIGEFSKATGLGIHTLRYYEHENLIIPLRNSRQYPFPNSGGGCWSSVMG